jgi:peroxiredoxin Q/BCP
MKKILCGLAALTAMFFTTPFARADMPKVGDTAPAFTALDQDGKSVSLADFAGKKNVLLYFYPKDFTGGCTKEACGLRDRMGDLKTNNVEVLGVSYDSAESHKKFIAENHLNFNLLADTEGKLIALYDVKMSFMKMSKRVSFLIGTDGKIIHVTDALSAQTHFDEMTTAIADLKK